MDYTAKAKTALGLAASAARSMGQNYIGTEHILLGLIRQQTGMAAQALLVNGVDETKLVDLIMELIAPTGHLELKEAEAAKWLTKNQLDSVTWLPADILLIDQIRKCMK